MWSCLQYQLLHTLILQHLWYIETLPNPTWMIGKIPTVLTLKIPSTLRQYDRKSVRVIRFVKMQHSSACWNFQHKAIPGKFQFKTTVCHRGGMTQGSGIFINLYYHYLKLQVLNTIKYGKVKINKLTVHYPKNQALIS